MEVGQRLRSEGVEITRILVSPFLRCVQTTAGFIKGMYPEGTDISKLKVSALLNFYSLPTQNQIFSLRDPHCGSILHWGA
jgi:phosphohistidine phosphatase SixA